VQRLLRQTTSKEDEKETETCVGGPPEDRRNVAATARSAAAAYRRRAAAFLRRSNAAQATGTSTGPPWRSTCMAPAIPATRQISAGIDTLSSTTNDASETTPACVV